jgi:HlyD family secretion protein
MIITSIIFAIIALIIFNKTPFKKKVLNTYSEVKKGTFEITITHSGELNTEKSTDINGPDIGQGTSQGYYQGASIQRQQNRDGNIHTMDLTIQDIVPEGTIVKEGDYIAQLDKTIYENSLKDELEILKTLKVNLKIKILDTKVALTNLRNEIKNQKYAVEEAEFILKQSKIKSPAILRKAKTTLHKEQRTLDQKKKSYEMKTAQSLSEIKHEKMLLSKETMLVNDFQVFLAKFTVTAPSPGMVKYKKDRNGVKRKTGSAFNTFDRVIAIIHDLSSMISMTYVDEIEISKVKIGQKVNIKVDSLPGKVFAGNVISISNIGEQLSNSDAKMFEVQIRVGGSDPFLRPSMTTGNKIITETFNDVVFIPTECVQAGPDSIPFVYKRNKTKQIVVLGKWNEKNVIVEQGLKIGTLIYLVPPEESQKFKLVGENLISIIKKRKQAF